MSRPRRRCEPSIAVCVRHVPLNSVAGYALEFVTVLLLSPNHLVFQVSKYNEYNKWQTTLLPLIRTVKPSPHQQQCRNNIVECYKVECCFDIVVGVDRA